LEIYSHLEIVERALDFGKAPPALPGVQGRGRRESHSVIPVAAESVSFLLILGQTTTNGCSATLFGSRAWP
jgi:hypothetical protein